MSKITFNDLIDVFKSIANIARYCGVKPPSVCGWRDTGSIPESKLILMAPYIESKTKNSERPFTRKTMFPDKWHVIWPELADGDKAVNE